MAIETTMKAVVTTGCGDYDKLEYRDVPVPVPAADQLLLRVLAAGVNNTEINTRVGWYSSSVSHATDAAADRQQHRAEQLTDGGWSGATPFPLIQGTDCCGEVVAAGDPLHAHLFGRRVLVRACMRPRGYHDYHNIWMASDFDGAFAQYVAVPASEVFTIDCEWSNEELATIPCAYGTAENMLHRAGVGRGHHVLVSGASGGVGSATVQLAARRGASVTAICSADKADRVREIGAARVVDRHASTLEILGENAVDVVVDNVAGEAFASMLKVLRRGGKYVSSGAIAGPLVTLDMRDMYLKDILLIGCTAWDEPVFANVIRYIENGEIQPLLAKTFALKDIAQAQREFMQKRHVGNFVLVPPQ